VARVVVDVMLKPEILDPQGQAIANALPTLGFAAITAVRQGKRFEVEIDGDLTDEVMAEVTRAAGTLLSNPVIEDFVVYAATADDEGPGKPAVEETATIEAAAAQPVAVEPAAAEPVAEPAEKS
jgi:phosphoribosylformylglycinamidine synthase PurS subunit